MYTYDTMVEALNGLKTRGYTLNFNIRQDHLACEDHDLYWHPEEFEIVEVHRFEGMTNPDDQSILYAIESTDGQKGVFVSAYGVYSDPVSDELMKKIHLSH